MLMFDSRLKINIFFIKLLFLGDSWCWQCFILEVIFWNFFQDFLTSVFCTFFFVDHNIYLQMIVLLILVCSWMYYIIHLMIICGLDCFNIDIIFLSLWIEFENIQDMKLEIIYSVVNESGNFLSVKIVFLFKGLQFNTKTFVNL